jgi:hypothetical protein
MFKKCYPESNFNSFRFTTNPIMEGFGGGGTIPRNETAAVQSRKNAENILTFSAFYET